MTTLSRLSLFALLAAPTAALAQEQTGQLVVVVFEVGSGRLLADQAVFSGEAELGRTDASGRLILFLKPGVYPLAVRTAQGALESIGDVRINAGLVTEALLTWFPDGRPATALIEEPTEGQGVAGPEEDGPIGIVRGRITNSEDGRPIPNARIFVRGSRADARTDSNGQFTLEVAAGQRDLSIIHDKFATQSVNNVQVVAGEPIGLDIELVPAGLALEDFTIRVPRIEGGTSALLDERRTSSAVGDVLGAEQMAKSGDSSAASALGRVTGLTVVGGKFVYVRGLGERYSSILLNGASLPSPEPERRVVPLDMFPSGVLESVVIQKTFSPDMPGEFGGGSIQLRTKNIPTEPVFSMSVSGGYNSITTFKQGMDYDGGRGDFFGMGAASRGLPDEVAAASEVARIAPSDRFCTENCRTVEELEQWGESLDNVWTPYERDLPPDVGVSMAVGTGSETALFGRPAGVLYGGSFGNAWERRQFTRGYYSLGANEELQLNNQYDFEQTTNLVNWSNILALGTSPADGHELRATTLVLRQTDDETRLFSGLNDELGTQIRSSRLRYVERMLVVQQLSGEHTFGERGPTATWRYSTAVASRVEPDRRQTQYDFEEANQTYLLSTRASGNLRFFSGLTDRNHDIAGELKVPFGPEVGEDDFRAALRFGGMYATKTRDVRTQRFQFIGRGEGAYDDDVNQKNAEEIFSPENIRPDAYQFEETTLPTDNYTATHQLMAGYAMAELPFSSAVRLMAGTRLEASDQIVTTFRLFEQDLTPIESQIKTLDLLPAATLTVSPTAKSNIRLGFGRTVSRPDFREMSPAQFADVTGGRTVRGNDELERSLIANYDLRYELYPSPSETFSVGVFYKDFTRPIETVLRISAERTTTWQNADAAWLVGTEVDFRKSLNFLTERLQDVYAAGNVALIQSRVELDGAGGLQTNNIRPMQGQSPYVINLSLGYDDPEGAVFGTVLYNVFGRRIMEAGSQGQPDTYEESIHQLDAVFGAKLENGLKFGLKLGNLLDSPSRMTVGDREAELVKRGRDVSVSVGWRL